MLGWFSALAARASAMKRWARLDDSSGRLCRIFRATSRWRRGYHARYTAPPPPSPSNERILYGPNAPPAPGASTVITARGRRFYVVSVRMLVEAPAEQTVVIGDDEPVSERYIFQEGRGLLTAQFDCS